MRECFVSAAVEDENNFQASHKSWGKKAGNRGGWNGHVIPTGHRQAIQASRAALKSSVHEAMLSAVTANKKPAEAGFLFDGFCIIYW